MRAEDVRRRGRGRAVAATVVRAGARAAAALLLAACSSATDNGTITNAIEISPPDPQVALAETLTLTATVHDENGHPVAATVFWSSSDAEIATVSQAGVVTPKRIGEVDIAASAQGRSGVTRVRVVRKRAAKITLAPASASASVGDTIPLEVVVEAVDGERLTDRTVTFASTEPTVADVVGAGLAVARAPGSTNIVARVEEVADTSRMTVARAAVASVDVSPAAPALVVGQSVRLFVTVRDAKGRTLTDRTVTFSSSRTSVATVSSDGEVTARAEGEAVITATADGVSDKVTVKVSPVPLAQLTLSPSSFALRVGESRTITATLRDASGAVVTGRTVSWSSSAPLVASVDPSGKVTGLVPGAAVITARVDGIEASAGVTVGLVPVRSVSVSPGSAAMIVGDRQAFTATATDENGQPATGRTIIWSSSNTGVAAVSSTGEVIATGAGSATITASVEGVQGTASVTVTPAPVAGVSISPGSAELDVGGTRQLTATVTDSRGNVVTGRTVAWSSSNTAVATVSGSGLVTAVGGGEASIAATVDGVSGTAAITVIAPPPTPGPAAQLRVVSGNGQTGRRNQTLSDPVVVQVLDRDGIPVPGVRVRFEASMGGSFDPNEVTTDTNGRASARWRLGNPLGTQNGSATLTSNANISVSLTATALP